MIEVEVGQIWEDEKTKFVISKVFDFGEETLFSAVCFNGETINREDVVYLEDLNCIREEKNEDWIDVLSSFSIENITEEIEEEAERKRVVDVLGGLLVASEYLKVSTTTLFYWVKNRQGSKKTKAKIKVGLMNAGIDFKGLI